MLDCHSLKTSAELSGAACTVGTAKSAPKRTSIENFIMLMGARFTVDDVVSECVWPGSRSTGLPNLKGRGHKEKLQELLLHDNAT